MTEAEFLPLFDRYRSMVYGLALSYPRRAGGRHTGQLQLL